MKNRHVFSGFCFQTETVQDEDRCWIGPDFVHRNEPRWSRSVSRWSKWPIRLALCSRDQLQAMLTWWYTLQYMSNRGPDCVFCPPGVEHCRPCPPGEPNCSPCPPYETQCKRCPPGVTDCLHRIHPAFFCEVFRLFLFSGESHSANFNFSHKNKMNVNVWQNFSNFRKMWSFFPIWEKNPIFGEKGLSYVKSSISIGQNIK